MRKLAIAIVIVGVLVTAGGVFALPGTTIELAGHMNLRFTDELLVEDAFPSSNETLVVRVSANVNAVPDELYLGTLFLDGVEAAIASVSWSADEIPGTPKGVVFSGLDLDAATDVTVTWRGPATSGNE